MSNVALFWFAYCGALGTLGLVSGVVWVCRGCIKKRKGRLDRQNELRREHARRMALNRPLTTEEWDEFKAEMPFNMPRGDDHG